MQKTLQELAQAVGGEITGDGSIPICGIAGIEDAKEGEITFIANKKYIKKAEHTKASAIICSPAVSIASKTLLKTQNPYLAYAKIARIFYPKHKECGKIDEHTVIGRGVTFGQDVTVYPFCFVGDGCIIEAKTTIYPFCFIGDRVTIGEETTIYPNVTIREGCRIGKRVIIHSGTVIGSDGFGFAKDGAVYYKIPQVGIVQIDDDVEIGANNTIDRAALGATRIKRGVKTDNLVHIAHNVTVGEDTIVVAQVGISGSTTIGDRVTLAGQVGIVGHITIGDDVMVGAKTGVSGDVAASQIVSGYPHMPHREWLKVSKCLSRLPEMRKTLRDLEEKMRGLEATVKKLKTGR